MVARLVSVVFDAADPARLARYWADTLGWVQTVEEPDGVVIAATGAAPWDAGGPPALTFVPVDDPKTGKNRVHLDLVSASEQEQFDTVGRVLTFGGRLIDIGQANEPWVVLADPEGNELCVLEPRDDYRDSRDIAAVVVDCVEPPRLAEFWSEVTGWQQSTATAEAAVLRHPDGAATCLEFIAVPERKQGKNRLHLDLTPDEGDDLATELARVRRLGAHHIDTGQGDVSWEVLADPEGNEFCLLPPR